MAFFLTPPNMQLRPTDFRTPGRTSKAPASNISRSKLRFGSSITEMAARRCPSPSRARPNSA